MRSANFVEETTTSIAGTGGNGAVTLTAVTGRPRFSTVFGTQATDIRYVIEDTTNGKFEVGIGSVASNVLTRTRPQVTWDGTTYDDSTPAAYAFGSAPASGNIKVRMAATAESQAPTFPGNNVTVLSGDNLQQYPASSIMKTNSNGSSAIMPANVEHYWLYKLEKAGLLVGMTVPVWTGAATGLLKTSLYSLGSSGLAEQKIVDFNVVDASTSGDKADTATGTWSPAGPKWMTPGWYVIGGICNVDLTLWGLSPTSAMAGSSPYGRVNGYGDSNLITVPGKSYATGMPAVPNFSGAVLQSGHQIIGAILFGLKVTA